MARSQTRRTQHARSALACPANRAPRENTGSGARCTLKGCVLRARSARSRTSRVSGTQHASSARSAARPSPPRRSRTLQTPPDYSTTRHATSRGLASSTAPPGTSGRGSTTSRFELSRPTQRCTPCLSKRMPSPPRVRFRVRQPTVTWRRTGGGGCSCFATAGSTASPKKRTTMAGSSLWIRKAATRTCTSRPSRPLSSAS
mmetsp:Transcript_53701/g.127668  ORF Transcript_53701/g.127668 Transcript_53701/m.127668 type:complete len:201 (-) Transcript_53701:678-1280(-)